MMNMNEQNAEKFNQIPHSVVTDIKLVGDPTVHCQIIMLLAYIRDILNNCKTGTIRVSVGKHLNSDEFGFSVKDQEIQNVIAQDYLEIS